MAAAMSTSLHLTPPSRQRAGTVLRWVRRSVQRSMQRSLQRSVRRWWGLLALASVGMSCLGFGVAWAQQPPSADTVKAAYIHKFLSYIEWPATALPADNGPLRVGVVGADKVFNDLTTIAAGHPVQGRAMQVVRVTQLEEADDVHLLFVGRAAWKDLAAWVGATKAAPVAVVTDAPNGIELGAALQLILVDDRVRFDASISAAVRAGVRLSSRLLAVAEHVVGASP
jgi:hypothetical protein